MGIKVVLGDINQAGLDAIVHAANSALFRGRGVDGAIHPPGQAVATTAGRLPARWVIHTAGPVYSRGQNRSRLLASCYRESLRVADELGARSVAFPVVSAGIYGWPVDDAALIALTTVRDAPSQVAEARFVLFTPDVLDAFRQAMDAEGPTAP